MFIALDSDYLIIIKTLLKSRDNVTTKSYYLQLTIYNLQL